MSFDANPKSNNDVIRVEVKNKVVFRITNEGTVLINEQARFTNKELAEALRQWAETVMGDDSADWWKKGKKKPDEDR